MTLASIVRTRLALWRQACDTWGLGDRRLEAEGCHLILLSWHLQAGSRLGTGGAERLDVVFEPDEAHPRIHRHPYGEPNPVRQPSDLPPPHAWLHRVDEQLGWLLSTKVAQSSEQD